MRESRTSGSEGGQGREALVYPPFGHEDAEERPAWRPTYRRR